MTCKAHLTRRRFIYSTLVSTGVMGLCPKQFIEHCPAETTLLDQKRASRPNIIFILADDMGYGDLSILGQKNFKTPNLDRMFKEGMFLSNHYAGSTVCAPSRATLLTGRHTGHVWQRGNGPIEFRPDPKDITIATRLKEAGYHTAMIGKSGVACVSEDPTLPNRKGFDHFFGFLCHVAAHRYFPPKLYRNGEEISFPSNYGKHGTVYSGDLILDESLNYIDSRSESDKPFFLHLALQQPHADLYAPEEFRTPYLDRFEEVPFTGNHYRAESHPAATYAAMINYIDHCVRRVLQKLRQRNIEKDTLVIFSSDNGSHHVGGYHHSVLGSNAPFRGGKRDLYEGGIRVPTIAWWPGTIEPGSRSDHLSAFWDFTPTAMELAGLPIPTSEIDGISYLPTLLGQPDKQRHHTYLYWEFHESNGKQAVRYDKWKGVRLDVMKDRHGPLELYNLEDDPSETTDIAAAYPDIVNKIACFMDQAHKTPEFEGFGF